MTIYRPSRQILTPRKMLLLDLLQQRNHYEEYVRGAINPTAWWRFRETSGSIAVNSAYSGGVGAGVFSNAEAPFTFTADDPDSWTVSAEGANTEVSEVGTGEGHGGAGTGYVNIWKDSAIASVVLSQTGLTVGDTYVLRAHIETLTGASVLQPCYANAANIGSTLPAAVGLQSSDNFIATQNNVGVKGRTADTDLDTTLSLLQAYKIGELDAANTAATVGQTGKLGANEAYDLDGATSYLRVTDSANLRPTEVTYAMLVNPDTSGELGSGRFFTHATQRYLRFQGALTTLNSLFDCATTDATAVTTTGLTAGQWAWVFLTYSNTGDRMPHIYKGVGGAVSEFAYSSQVAGVGALVTPAAGLFIGNLDQNAAVTFDGKMDEVLIVNRVLTTSEMQTLVDLAGV